MKFSVVISTYRRYKRIYEIIVAWSAAGADEIIGPTEIREMASNRKEVKKRLKEFNVFIAEAPLMPRVGRVVGQAQQVVVGGASVLAKDVGKVRPAAALGPRRLDIGDSQRLRHKNSLFSNLDARRFKVGIYLWMDWRTPTAFKSPSSAVPGFFVMLNLQPFVEGIETGEQVDDSQQFEYRFIVQTQAPHRGGVD